MGTLLNHVYYHNSPATNKHGHCKAPPPHVLVGDKVATVLPMVGGRVLEGAVVLCHPTFTAI